MEEVRESLHHLQIEDKQIEEEPMPEALTIPAWYNRGLAPHLLEKEKKNTRLLKSSKPYKKEKILVPCD